MGIHDGHRKRLKARFLEHGLDTFEDHVALELLLFYAKARGDVNPLAHELINRFGSLAGVFDASVEELMEVSGVGENTALLLKLMPQMNKKYMVNRVPSDRPLIHPEDAWHYLRPRFYGLQDEMVCLVSLDDSCRVKNCSFLSHGTVNAASVSLRKIVETALSNKASSVILAHNHTGGIMTPSEADEETTRQVVTALNSVEIRLRDHIIICGDEYFSFADNGFFS